MGGKEEKERIVEMDLNSLLLCQDVHTDASARLGHDAMVYINMDSRKDKRKLIEKQLEAQGLFADRFRAIEYPKDQPGSFLNAGLRGCMESHYAVVKLARDNRWRSVLILEDDAYLNPKLRSRSLAVLRVLCDVRWDILYYYGSESDKKTREDHLVVPIDKAVYGSQGIAVHSRCYEMYLERGRRSKVSPDIFVSNQVDWTKWATTEELIRQWRHENNDRKKTGLPAVNAGESDIWDHETA